VLDECKPLRAGHGDILQYHEHVLAHGDEHRAAPRAGAYTRPLLSST